MIFNFGRQRKLAEWEAKVLNLAASVLNEQRVHLLEESAKDEALVQLMAEGELHWLTQYEMGFLWGFFEQGIRVCPVKIDGTKEIKRLIEMRGLNREEPAGRAKQIAEAAAQKSNSNEELFELVRAIGARAIGNPNLFNDSMTIYFREVVRGNIRTADKQPTA